MRSQSNEILFDNYLDIEIQRIFFPLNFIQWLYLLPKYRIYKNFITFNRPIVNVTSTVFVFAIIFFLQFRFYLLFHNIPLNEISFFEITLIYDSLCYSVGFLMCLYLNFNYAKDNVELVLNVQRTFKLINFNNYKYFTKFNVYSWCGMTGTLLYTILLLTMSYLVAVSNNYLSIIYLFIAYFDISVLYISRIISLFNFQLKLWILQFEHSVNVPADRTKLISKLLLKLINLKNVGNILFFIFGFTD